MPSGDARCVEGDGSSEQLEVVPQGGGEIESAVSGLGWFCW